MVKIKKIINNHLMHTVVIIVAHLFPLLLFLILPKFGISNQWSITLAILVMIASHGLMMKRHTPNKHIHQEHRK